jgi:hypothetical protein
MSLSDQPRELAISQKHVGTTLLAGLIGLSATCLVATLAMAAVWEIASRVGSLACLILPAVILVLLSGSMLLQWGERFLPRLWPSGRRLLLDADALTLERRGRLVTKVAWGEPCDTLRWRLQGPDPVSDSVPPPGTLYLACQLKQESESISVYTKSSPHDWRRVPGWKQFALLESPRRPSQAQVLRGLFAQTGWRRRAKPAHRGVSSLPEGDPASLWPAELNRQRQGWELSFGDFCALMEAVDYNVSAQEYHA